MKHGYQYIKNEHKRLGLSPIKANQIDEIILSLIQLNQKDYIDIYFNLETDLSVKIIMKSILDNKGGNLFYKIFYKEMGSF